MSVLDRSALEDSPLADLHALASELGIDGFRRLRKADLIDKIIAQQGGEEAQVVRRRAPPDGLAVDHRRLERQQGIVQLRRDLEVTEEPTGAGCQAQREGPVVVTGHGGEGLRGPQPRDDLPGLVGPARVGQRPGRGARQRHRR